MVNKYFLIRQHTAYSLLHRSVFYLFITGEVVLLGGNSLIVIRVLNYIIDPHYQAIF